MIIKEAGVYVYRVPTKRDVEDWRNEPTEKRLGAWAVHCMNHDQRSFFPSYAKAKDYAPLPEPCPACKAFDQRCTHCPSDVDQWLANPNTGYVPSVGHITGNPVCAHHKYGAIPEGIEYDEQWDRVGEKALVAVMEQEATNRQTKVVTVAFQPEERSYYLQCHFGSDSIAPERAAIYSQALKFALMIAASLNATLNREANNPPELVAFGGFETWEQVAARNALGK